MKPRLLALCPVALAFQLHAQSFNCARATTPREHAVCNSDPLRKLDSDVGVEFSRVHKGVPAVSAASILADQRAWLQGIDAACSAQMRGSVSFNDCLNSEYNSRLSELQQDKPLDDGHWLITTRPRGDMRPVILTPNQAELAWNNAVIAQIARRNHADAKELAGCRHEATGMGGDRADDMEVDESWHLAGANSHLIVMKFTHFEYCGGAHPSTGFDDWNWSLDLNREITPADVFRSGSDWKPAFIAGAKTRLQSDPDMKIWDGKNYADGMSQAVGSTKGWQLTRDGLSLQFQQYQIAAYVFRNAKGSFLMAGTPTLSKSCLKPEQLPAGIPDPADQ